MAWILQSLVDSYDALASYHVLDLIDGCELVDGLALFQLETHQAC